MATYYGTYGQKVQYLASDPASPQSGQVWFNSTSNLLKVGVSIEGSWATGGSLATGRALGANAGTQTAALGFGGYASGAVANTEEYNGTSWTISTSLTTARYDLGGAGTQTVGLGFGGQTTTALSAATEEYSGSFVTTTPSILTTS